MSGDRNNAEIRRDIMEGIMNKLDVSMVARVDGWTMDTYVDTAGNRIEDNAYSWFQGPDSAICSNGAVPTDAQIQAAIRRSRSGEVHDVSGNRTQYLFATKESPLEQMCAIAARPTRTR